MVCINNLSVVLIKCMKQIDAKQQRAIALLKKAGFRATQARISLMLVLSSTRCAPLLSSGEARAALRESSEIGPQSVQQLNDTLLRQGCACDLVTTYRIVADFEKAGFVTRISLSSEGDLFEASFCLDSCCLEVDPAQEQKHQHAHFLCVKCRRVYGIPEESRHELQVTNQCMSVWSRKLVKLGFSEVVCSLDFRGVCLTCAS